MTLTTLNLFPVVLALNLSTIEVEPTTRRDGRLALSFIRDGELVGDIVDYRGSAELWDKGEYTTNDVGKIVNWLLMKDREER